MGIRWVLSVIALLVLSAPASHAQGSPTVSNADNEARSISYERQGEKLSLGVVLGKGMHEAILELAIADVPISSGFAISPDGPAMLSSFLPKAVDDVLKRHFSRVVALPNFAAAQSAGVDLVMFLEVGA